MKRQEKCKIGQRISIFNCFFCHDKNRLSPIWQSWLFQFLFHLVTMVAKGLAVSCVKQVDRHWIRLIPPFGRFQTVSEKRGKSKIGEHISITQSVFSIMTKHTNGWENDYCFMLTRRAGELMRDGHCTVSHFVITIFLRSCTNSIETIPKYHLFNRFEKRARRG